MKTQTTREATEQTKLAGKYLTFSLGRETCAIPVLKVREIIKLTSITAIPQMPRHVKGVLNLRGKIIPVMDLRAKLGHTATEDTERTCIVVVQVSGNHGNTMQTGLIVDMVEEVANISAAEIETTPEFGIDADTAGLLGMAKLRTKVVSLLDIDRIVDGAELRNPAWTSIGLQDLGTNTSNTN